MPTLFTPRSSTVAQLSPNYLGSSNAPMAFWSEGVEVGINVFLYTNNTVSNFQPPYWEPFTNADGTVFPGVKKVWYGGHKNLITDAEAVILTAAGYGADITYDAIYDSSTYDSTDTLA